MRNNLIRTLMAAFLVMATSQAWANTVQTVTQVSGNVTVPNGVDYHISGSQPFAGNATVNLTSDGTGVVILDAVKPSLAVRLISQHILIDGQKSKIRLVNGKLDGQYNNCDIRIHSQGTIIYPYTEKDHPLTVYSDRRYRGTAISNFGLEDTGGYMNTLTNDRLNNNIRSFKLRRGYMVTFSTRAEGRGYSRCFIAGDKDLEVPTMPAILDRSISSYRVFKWNDTSKKGISCDMDTIDNHLLRTTSTFDWAEGWELGLDLECVRHHCQHWWPDIPAVGRNDFSVSAPTIKTNNEPSNPNDGAPCDVAEVLSYWQDLMRTGKRLCSPSSYDGDGGKFQHDFLDSIDARGWRCDVVDVHCYWDDWQFNTLVDWYNRHKRPIWISEWDWGGPWNNNGSFAPGVSAQTIADRVWDIISRLESWNYVERYFYWNDQGLTSSRLTADHKLTTVGERYASMNSKVGYDPSIEFIPTIPKAKGGPSDFTLNYTQATKKAELKWYEPNGEYNSYMTVEVQSPNSTTWRTVSEITLEEDGANYAYTAENIERGSKLRIHTVYADGKNYYSTIATAISDVVTAGDAITYDNETKYAGGEVLDNGDFSMGAYGWKNGKGEELSAPDFKVVSHGGYINMPFVQAFSSGEGNDAGSISTTVDIEPQSDYFFSGAVRFPDGEGSSKIILSGENVKDSVFYTIPSSDYWTRFENAFNSGVYTKATLSFTNLKGQAAFSNLSLKKLFGTKDDALADAKKTDERKEELEKDHVTFAQLAEQAKADSIAFVAKALADQGLTGDSYTFTAENGLIENPNFTTTSNAWKKDGSYQGGEQGVSKLDDTPCWTASWRSINASLGKQRTMQVSQQLSKALNHGIYMLSVDAATDHNCISDQHGFLVINGDTLNTPTLSWDVADLPSVVTSKWQTLSTAPLYVDDNTNATVGFTGSKDGAIDNSYKPYNSPNGSGRRHEGSWYATNFRFLHLQAYKLKADSSKWCTFCLPYAVSAESGLRLFTVAGRDKDGKKIYLNEVDKVEGGQPCIALLVDTTQIVVEEGEAVSRAKSDNDGMWGYFETGATQRMPQGSLYLSNGSWITVTSSRRTERPHVESYSGIIRDINNLPVLESWDGISMTVDGSGDATAINGITSGTSAPVYYFDLNGHRIAKPVQSGLYIRVQGDKVEKIVVK